MKCLSPPGILCVRFNITLFEVLCQLGLQIFYSKAPKDLGNPPPATVLEGAVSITTHWNRET